MLVDDNASYRQRMVRLLQLQADFEIDFRMTGLDGYTAARTIVQQVPQVKVFMLTAFPGALDRDKVQRSGLQGLLVKDQPATEIVDAIRSSVRPRSGPGA